MMTRKQRATLAMFIYFTVGAFAFGVRLALLDEPALINKLAFLLFAVVSFILLIAFIDADN